MRLRRDEHSTELRQLVRADARFDAPCRLLSLLYGALVCGRRRALRIADVVSDERQRHARILGPRRPLDRPPAIDPPAIVVEVGAELRHELSAAVHVLEIVELSVAQALGDRRPLRRLFRQLAQSGAGGCGPVLEALQERRDDLRPFWADLVLQELDESEGRPHEAADRLHREAKAVYGVVHDALEGVA